MSKKDVEHLVPKLLEALRKCDADAAYLVDEALPVSRLLEILQGGEDVVADGGIAAFSREDLDRVSAHAAAQASHDLDRLKVFLELLDCCASAGALLPSRAVLGLLCRQSLLLLAEFRRWNALAGNAAYYRDHRDTARRVADASPRRGWPSQASTRPAG